MKQQLWRWIGLVLGLVGTCGNIKAQSEKPTFWQKMRPDSLVNRELHVLPLPVFRTSPETGLQVGISTDYFFNADESDSSANTRNSYAWLQVLYSTRRQLIVEPAWQIYTKNENYQLRGKAGYVVYSEHFWGVGNETLPDDDYINASYNRSYFQGDFYRRTTGKLFLGVTTYFSDVRNIKFDDPERVSEVPLFLGTETNRIVGIGPNILLDYRNDPFSPTRGWYTHVYYRRHFSGLGSTFNYGEQFLDFRKYFPLNAGSLVAVQAMGQFTKGEVPFHDLPRLGGSNIMRGYLQGRFRDRQLWSAQTEYRRNLGRFLVAAAFVSAGGVAPAIKDFSAATTRYGGGAGLRILINRKMNLYTRLDFAVTSDRTTGFYFRIFDAF